jgi:PAS domain S-box-containing protein
MMTDSLINSFADDGEGLPPAERRYRALAEAMPQLVWATDARGRCFYFNRRWYEYTGLSEAESLGLGFASALHPDDREQTLARWEQAWRTGASYAIEYRFRRHDGAYHWFIGRAMPIYDQSGAIVEWAGTCTDIDEQKRTSEMLGFIKRTLDQIHDCVFMFAPTTLRFFYVNQGAVDQLGYSRDELLSMTPLEIKPEFDEAQFRAMIAPLVAGERSLHQFETLHLHKDGRKLPVEITLQYLEDSETPAHFVAVVRDISERRRAALALEERNRELDQFAYVTSHDLKAPLRGIANLAQWIEEDLGEQISPEVCEHLKLLRGRVQRMEGLINGLLQYSRVGRTEAVIEQVDVGALLREVIDLLDPPAGFTLELASDLPSLWTSRLLLERVFANLLENALKHGQRPDLTVSITAERIGPLYTFRVTDNGQGIAPRYHERIFGIFQTLAARDSVEGSGLGLALIKKIVGHQGGRIWVESDLGAGASFAFTWPVHPRRP